MSSVEVLLASSSCSFICTSSSGLLLRSWPFTCKSMNCPKLTGTCRPRVTQCPKKFLLKESLFRFLAGLFFKKIFLHKAKRFSNLWTRVVHIHCLFPIQRFHDRAVGGRSPFGANVSFSYIIKREKIYILSVKDSGRKTAVFSAPVSSRTCISATCTL